MLCMIALRVYQLLEANIKILLFQAEALKAGINIPTTFVCFYARKKTDFCKYPNAI